MLVCGDTEKFHGGGVSSALLLKETLQRSEFVICKIVHRSREGTDLQLEETSYRTVCIFDSPFVIDSVEERERSQDVQISLFKFQVIQFSSNPN